MKWTKEDKERLLLFKDSVDSDEIKIKEQIKRVLLDNRYIAHVLHNEELEKNDGEPDDYFGVNSNIRPAFIVPETEIKTKNIICYEIGYRHTDIHNPLVKLLQITIYILCQEEDLMDKETGIARHDLLSALVQDSFNYSNYFGNKLELVSNLPGTINNLFVTRTMVFEQRTDNNVVKSRKIGNAYIPMMSNKEVVTLGKET